jgi:FkbM family methyltransferase
MGAVKQTKNLVKEAFPSLWLRWHFMQRPKSAEVELSFLKKVVPEGAITIDVGANCGLYTRELSRLSKIVHAFEPSQQMATLLRRTSAANVNVHETALSDRSGHAQLMIPKGDDGLVHGLASIEPQAELSARPCLSLDVPTARLDEVIRQDVAFVKIDVEGHELSVLEGASGLIDRSQPVFLVEAEDRHRPFATKSIFKFFRDKAYRGFFLKGERILPVEEFDPQMLQDPDSLLPQGGRKTGRFYINNFFFFPPHRNGMAILNG